MSDHNRNSKLGTPREFDAASDYLRTLTRRLIYLYEKRASASSSVKGPLFQDDEIDAIFWALAFYKITTGRDVAPQFQRQRGGERIDLARFNRMVEHVKGWLAHIASSDAESK